MALLDGVIGPIAKQIIDQFGTDIQIVNTVVAAYDVNTSEAIKTETAYTVKGLIEDYNLQDSGAGFTSGLIQANDRKVTIAGSGLTFEPKPGFKAVVLGTTYSVTRVLRTLSGEKVALYELNVRL